MLCGGLPRRELTSLYTFSRQMSMKNDKTPLAKSQTVFTVLFILYFLQIQASTRAMSFVCRAKASAIGAKWDIRNKIFIPGILAAEGISDPVSRLDMIVKLVWHRLYDHGGNAEIGKAFINRFPMRAISEVKRIVLGQTYYTVAHS